MNNLQANVCLLAVTQSAIISPAVGLYYPEVDVWVFAATVFLNDALFPIAFSIPLLILMQEELGFSPARNRKALTED